MANRPVAFRGLRPLDPQRDLDQVADLIEEAFAGELEPGGVAALRDLRMLSRMGPLVSLMARSDPFIEDVLGGFVWIEAGRVVGNATLQRLDPYGSRWQVANVAVAPPYRGQGIGRALVVAALERIAEKRGAWAVLQVRKSNQIALGLYERLGFEPLTQEATLRLARVSGLRPAPVEPPGWLRPFQNDEWRARYDLEYAARSALARWWRPIHAHNFLLGFEKRSGERFWELLGRNRVRRWVAAGQNGLAGWLAIDARRWQGIHHLEITVHPSRRGELEKPLVDYAIAFLADYPRWPVRIEHPGEHHEMIDALRQAGFELVRDHLAMRKKMNYAPSRTAGVR